MDEIPEDVMKAAKNAFKDIPRVNYALWGTQQLGTAFVENYAIEAVARAILAERDACVKIADETRFEFEKWWWSAFVAKAIRRR